MTLSAAPVPNSKLKKEKLVSDSRGEFAFRVPAAPMKYQLRVEAKGYAGESREVAIQGEDHVEVSFRLAPTSNK